MHQSENWLLTQATEAHPTVEVPRVNVTELIDTAAHRALCEYTDTLTQEVMHHTQPLYVAVAMRVAYSFYQSSVGRPEVFSGLAIAHFQEIYHTLPDVLVLPALRRSQLLPEYWNALPFQGQHVAIFSPGEAEIADVVPRGTHLPLDCAICLRAEYPFQRRNV